MSASDPLRMDDYERELITLAHEYGHATARPGSQLAHEYVLWANHGLPPRGHFTKPPAADVVDMVPQARIQAGVRREAPRLLP
jgi:hypothetical protein